MKFVILSLLVLQVQCDFNQLFNKIQNSDHASQLQNHLSSLSNSINAKAPSVENLSSFFKGKDVNTVQVEPGVLLRDDAEGNNNKMVQNVRDLLVKRANQANGTFTDLKEILKTTKDSFLDKTSQLKDHATTLKNFDSKDLFKKNASEFVDHIKNLQESGAMKEIMTKHSAPVLGKIFGNISEACSDSFVNINSEILASKISETEKRINQWGTGCGQTEKLNKMTQKIVQIAQNQSDHLDRIMAELGTLSNEFKALVRNKDQTLLELLQGQITIMTKYPQSSPIFNIILAQVRRNTTASLDPSQFGLANNVKQVRPAPDSDRAQIQILPLSVKEISPMATAVEATDDMILIAGEDAETNQNENKKNGKNKNKKNKNKNKKNKDSSASEEEVAE